MLDALKSRGPSSARYRLTGEVAKGGMGVILRVWDEDLRRHLAMKVMLDEPEGAASRLSRFLEEAQVTGQLDHPGIVPVHELGIDARGQVFFTMKLVKGKTFEQVLDAVKRGDDGWNLTRALSVVLRVCEAMAFAHEKGVIHRDLKPANIMVGRFGETYVMDWGLARVLGMHDTKDTRPRPHDASMVRTSRRESSAGNPNSPLLTMDGDLIGTPIYMSPEQAHGDLERIGAHSDVYAVGAILYQLLSGQIPYVEAGSDSAPYSILERVRTVSPKPLHSVARDVPVELLAICEKAMEREPKQRYASMLDLADDLRAYLERRVVKAYETGAFAETKKWVQRNKGLASAAAALFVVLAGATVLIANKNREVEAKAVEVEAKNVSLGTANAEITKQKAEVEARRADAETRRAEAEARKAEFDQLSGVVLLDLARTNELALYPAVPAKTESMRRWLENDAAKLLAMKPTLARTVADLEAREAPQTDAERESRRFLHTTLSTLLADLATFEADTVASVRRRVAWAERIESLTLHHPNARVTWDEARAALAKADDVVASSRYQGTSIDLRPQLGLVPLGMNPVTKLWEFYDLRTACDLKAGEDPAHLEIPAHRADGSIEVKDGTGVVFVLIPGGTFVQGAQPDDESAPNFDPGTKLDEVPQTVTLAPYFLARHELTKGQWFRMTDGDEPSWYRRDQTYADDPTAIGWSHPVETVTWDDCELRLSRIGLALPTEAQWEFGARGGTQTPWWTGKEASTLAGAANVVDQRAESAFPAWGRQMGDFDDGYAGMAPPDAFRANPFGLFHVHGNVWEWCADLYAFPYVESREGDGLRSPPIKEAPVHARRGGGFNNTAAFARSAYRDDGAPSSRLNNLGARAARGID
ncbi:MAG: SUMF1/EgtB/PvdO family nonheme iron enzyme [Planctomycetes bacterium]|nr:SUMF1/EgtB/PvdO family nonheme iron enzyme [Planctomycetota bacterium]